MASACPVCGKDSEWTRVFASTTFSVVCTRCGRFRVAEQFVAAMQNDPARDWRWRLSCAIRRATDDAEELREVIALDTFQTIADRFKPAADGLEQVDLLVSAIARRSDHLGALTEAESAEAWAARVGLPAAKSLVELNAQVSDLLESHPTADDRFWYRLKKAGWQHAREIRRQKGTGNQAFVAMWFTSEMDAVFTEALRPAFEEVGYRAYRVDFDPHNEFINNKIIAEVRQSRILLAECTGARTSVYFEAGFALGLGLEVIWCCHDSRACEKSQVPFPVPPTGDGKEWFEKLSFDTSQYSFIKWATLPELKVKIVDRVLARGFELKSPRTMP